MNALSVEQRILNLMQNTGYNITQTNGQRIFGPPPNWPQNCLPPKGTEVFVGKLPRDCFEDELVPLFATIGPIYQLRLMVDFSGDNRGYAFVSYINQMDAQKAIHFLNRYEIRANHRIGVVESVDNCSLYIKNLPSNLSREEIFEVMKDKTPGVVAVELRYNKNGCKDRRDALIHYDTHRDAAMARRRILPEGNSFKLFGYPIDIEWAIPSKRGAIKMRQTNRRIGITSQF